MPNVTPEGRDPLSVKVIGVSPVAVTEKVPAVFSAKLVEVAEVNDGPVAVTFRVKAWVEVLWFPSVAVMVIGITPGRAEGRRARQGAVGLQGHARGQGSRSR